MRSQKSCSICLTLLAGLFAGCGVTIHSSPEVLAITSTIASGTVNVPYSATLTATGGLPPYKWSISSGSLPAGLKLNSAGVLSGTPSAPGSSTFTIQVTDSAYARQSASQITTLVINAAPPATLAITTTSPLPTGRVATAYTEAFAATGGTKPYTWSTASGTLPAGLTLTGAGILAGTPTAAGTGTFTVQVTDSSVTPQAATLAATLIIDPVLLTIATKSPLPAGTLNSPYALTLQATGGTAPHIWSVSSGKLPSGLTLSSAGVLSGTPSAAGTSAFTIEAIDSAGTPQTATLAATLTINVTPLIITTTSPLPAGTVNTPYAETLQAIGGTPPYTWSVSTGTLPAGLTLTAAGLISGTPTTAAMSTFTLKATDSALTPQIATFAATLAVNPVPLTITTTSPLPAGTLNTAYVATFKASGGTAPYSWSVASGALPAGLALTSTGILSGTPTAAGTSTFTIKATDSAATAQSATAPFTLVISVGALTITTTSLPSGYVGTGYEAQLAASGGVPPYVWSVKAGGLPTGMTLSNTGLLSGTPGSVSSTNPVFTVTDSKGTNASTSLLLTINAANGTVPDNYYSFVFAGTSPQGTPVAPNGIAINGIIKIQSGQVVSGYFDENFNTNPPILKASLTGGNLVLGANGLGQLVLTTATGTLTFALASPASVSAGGLTPIRMIEYDDATGAGSRGSGVIDPTPPNPITGDISGNFSFLFSGTDIDQNQQALVGSFQTDGAGNITNGSADANQVALIGGVPTRELVSFNPVGGSYSVDANGRGLLMLKLGGADFHFSFYEVSPQEWLVISLDPATLNSPLVSGIAYQQTGAPFSNTSLPAVSVLGVSGVVPATPTTTPVPDISAGLATSDGNGNVTYSFDEYNGSLVSGSSTVAYFVDPTTGRVTATAGDYTEPILYIINSTSAFYLGVGPSGQSGMIEAQSGAPFNAVSFKGNYLGGSLPLVLTSVLNESGLVTADGAGNIGSTTNRSSSAGLAYQNNAVVGTYTVGSNGRVVVTTPDGVIRIFYLVSPDKVDYLTSDSGGYLGSFEQ